MGLFLLFFLTHPARAAPTPENVCFDLSQANTALLRPEPNPFPKGEEEVLDYGTDPKSGYDWARVAGQVKKPIDTILKQFLNPMTTRDPETTQVTTSESEVPGAIIKQHIKVKVKPIFFLTIEWEEDWLFAVRNGSKKSPKSIVISYQKTSGTSHITHFCGNILIQAITPDRSNVYLTEEIKADRRTPEDVYKGLLGTLRALRP